MIKRELTLEDIELLKTRVARLEKEIKMSAPSLIVMTELNLIVDEAEALKEEFHEGYVYENGKAE